jgi:hypothetical protein
VTPSWPLAPVMLTQQVLSRSGVTTNVGAARIRTHMHSGDFGVY